jgi:hypothetical protein
MAPPKWAPEELFDPLDLANIQGGLHDLPKDVDSWIPKFSGEVGASGNTHWTKFCESYDFHQSGKEHPDTFMRLFFASLTGNARKWSTKLPSKSLTTCEDLEQVFLQRWGVMEDMASLYSQYLKICKQNDEDVREFNDRFNTLLGRIDSNFQPESAILGQYLNSFEGNFQSLLRNRFPTNLKEAQDGACRIEENLKWSDPISQVNLLHNQDDILWFNEENMEEQEHDFPEILEVNDEIKLDIPPKGTSTWKNGFSNMKDALIFSKQHEPHEDLGAPENIFEDWEGEKEDIECLPSQITEEDDFEEDSLSFFMLEALGQDTVNPHLFMLPSKSMISFSIIAFLTQILPETL